MLWLYRSRVRVNFLFYIFAFTVILRQENASEALISSNKKSKIEKILENAAILKM